MIIRQATRFGLVGLVNTATYLAVYLVLHLWVPYFVAHLLAYAVGIVVSFFLNSWYTYRTVPTVRKFLLYPLTQLTSLVLTTVGVTVLVEVVHMDERVAPFVAVALALPVTFLVSRRILTGDWLFRRQEPAVELAGDNH